MEHLNIVGSEFTILHPLGLVPWMGQRLLYYKKAMPKCNKNCRSSWAFPRAGSQSSRLGSSLGGRSEAALRVTQFGTFLSFCGENQRQAGDPTRG